MPGADIGLRAEDPTIATALKALGYATGQFGKNHFGDRDEFLPTVHGFDEFFGNLYHLNAEEEPELDDYPTEEDFPDFRKNFGPRGVIHSWANGDGTQRIEDTGPLTKERMKTIDDEVVPEALRFMSDAKDSRHAVLRVAQHHAHALPHPRQGRQPGQGRPLAVGVPRHDVSTTTSWSARCSTSSTSNGLADDTIVMYSTDNGPHMNTLARRRDDAVPQREELQLGGRLPGAGDGPLARAHPGRAGAQRHRQPQRLVRHAARRRRRHRRRRPAQGGHRPGRHDVQGAPRRPQPARLRHRARPTRARASTSSTSPTTAT